MGVAQRAEEARKQLQVQLEEQVKEVERASEEERKSLQQELTRVKQEVVTIMKVMKLPDSAIHVLFIMIMRSLLLTLSSFFLKVKKGPQFNRILLYQNCALDPESFQCPASKKTEMRLTFNVVDVSEII